MRKVLVAVAVVLAGTVGATVTALAPDAGATEAGVRAPAPGATAAPAKAALAAAVARAQDGPAPRDGKAKGGQVAPEQARGAYWRPVLFYPNTTEGLDECLGDGEFFLTSHGYEWYCDWISSPAEIALWANLP